MQARWDRKFRHWPVGDVIAARVVQQTAFDDCSRQFLDKQRDAVGTSGNLCDDLARQRFAGDCLGQSIAFFGVEAIEQQCTDMRRSAPGLGEFGTKGYDQQYWKPANSLDSQIQQLARGRVDPMDVLEHHQDRALPTQILQ